MIKPERVMRGFMGAASIAAAALFIAGTSAHADVIQFQAGIHPTTSYQSPGGMISSDNLAGNYVTWQQAYVGYDYGDPRDREWRTLYSFDVSAIPDNAPITSATFAFSVYQSDGASNADSLTLELHQVTGDFDAGQVTWNDRNQTTAWTTPGGDFGAALASVTVDPTTLSGLSPAVTFASTPALVAAIQAARDNAADFNLILTAVIPDGAADRGFIFTASDNVDVNSVPYHGVPPVLSVVIPEPATLSLLGVLGLGLLTRRRQR